MTPRRSIHAPSGKDLFEFNPPPSSALLPREKKLIASLRTPRQVQQWLHALPYNREKGGETLRSFRQVLRAGSVHCLEASLAAAVILEQHGYPPLLLSFESIDRLDHVIYVFRSRGKWGSVARSRDAGLHGRRPLFRTPRNVALSYFDPYVDLAGRITAYAVVNLNWLGDYDWRFSDRNVWKVEQYLLKMPHKKYRMPAGRYRKVLRRYTAFRAAHPTAPVNYYESLPTWMGRIDFPSDPVPKKYLAPAKKKR